ncbi:MAG: ATP-binding protein [Eubacterium sp.]|nr:ATP-binding protein [Eubacterium sp.]
MIINIVDNAVKYTPAGGKIVIRTKKEGNYVHVMIADNGNGITDKDKKHILRLQLSRRN